MRFPLNPAGGRLPGRVRSAWLAAFLALTVAIATALAGGAVTARAAVTVRAADELLSQGKPATASSVENVLTPASTAVDGNVATRWSSAFSDPQWLQVDLGASATISQVVLNWEAAYGRVFQIQTSTDGLTWTTVYLTVTGTGGVQTLPVTGTGRYVRMLGFARGTAYGYSLREFQVYGSGGGTTPPPGNGTIPDPTIASLEATAGPLATGTYTVPSPSGYKAGTITYPTASGSYPGIVLMPGYQGTQQNLSWLGPRLASWGFVVVNVDTNTLTDTPDQRGTEIRAAGTQLLNLSNATGNPISGKVNGTLGVSGHSMGGGGTMVALRDDSRFLAGAPLAPYHTSPNFAGVTKPTFFLTCASDVAAPGATYARPWYNSMAQAEKLYIEVPGDHLCPMTGYGNKAKQGKWLVSFFSRWLRNDTRFTPFLCGTQRDADRTNTSLVTQWTDTCPF